MTKDRGPGDQPQLQSVAHPAQQVAPLPEHEGPFAIEHHAGEVAGLSVSNWIHFPAVATIPAHQKSSIAAAGPDRTIRVPGHVHVAVPIGDRDDRFAPTVEIAGLVIQPDLGSAGEHPELSIRLIADALQPLAADPLVHLPDAVPGLPGGVEVAETADADVPAVFTPTQITHGSSSVRHLRFPGDSAVLGGVYGPHVCGQFGGMLAESCDQVRLPRELRIQKQASPVLAGVGGVHQQARLPGDPTLVSVEIDADQAEVLLLREIQAAFVPGDSVVVGFLDHPVAADQETVGAVGESDIKRIRFRVQVLGLPGTRRGNGQAGRDTAAETDAQHEHQQKIGSGGEQAIHGDAGQRREYNERKKANARASPPKINTFFCPGVSRFTPRP